MTALPQPPPEAELIAAKRGAISPALSARKAARRAGFSVALWSKIEKGYDQVARGVVIPFRGTAEKVARAAQVVGATAIELTACGRPDAAHILAALPPLADTEPMTIEEMAAELRRLSALIEGTNPHRGNGGTGEGNERAV